MITAGNRLKLKGLIPNRMVAALLMAFIISWVPRLHAQETGDPEYDEIGVLLLVQGVGSFEINAIYMNDRIYVPVSDLFGILKINHEVSRNNDTVSGFFLREDLRYTISRPGHTISLGSQTLTPGENSMLLTDAGICLRNDVFGKVFGLNLIFNFRNLSLELKTAHELPVVKELRLSQMRRNLNRLKGEVTADTTLGRDYHLFRGGMADWSVISTQVSEETSETRANLGIGAELFGGEANVLLNYSTRAGFDERQQQYRWRWANNDAGIVKQVMAGKLQPRSISSIYSPVLGVSATNTPTTFRKSFGSYILSDYTEPGWMVELYINNVIVEYTTADASGFFSFEVPLVYGASQVMLKFYGPWGEERIREQTLDIPYNFIPKGEVEYHVSTGMVRDTSRALFSRVEAGAGVHRNITVGGGVEYLSSIKENPSIPFLNTSVRFLNNFLLNAEYAHGVRSHGLLSYRLPSGLVFDIDYAIYEKDQQAISFNYLEERRASLSFPLRTGKVRSFGRLIYRQNVLKSVTYNTAEMLVSSYIGRMGVSLSGYASWLDAGTPYVYSNLALGIPMGRSIMFRPQAQLDITNGSLISARAELEKVFRRKAYLSLVYEENLRSAYRSVEVAFRYDLPFALTATSVRLTNTNLHTTESARGSFAFGSGNGYLHADNRSTVGRGGITLTPFLDINHNGLRDPGEPLASGLNVRINGGRLLKPVGDSLIRIMELEPYINYLLELDDNSLENIAWQLDKKVIGVNIDPNQFKQVMIPVMVMGEAIGSVYLKEYGKTKGQGRITLIFSDSSGREIHRSLSESDGFFNYMGLAPGSYSVAADTAQLSRLGLICEPAVNYFEIRSLAIGDIAGDLEFTLSKPGVPESRADTSMAVALKQEDMGALTGEAGEETAEMPAAALLDDISRMMASAPVTRLEAGLEPAVMAAVIEGNVNASAGRYWVQAGAFARVSNARAFTRKLEALSDYPVGVIKIGKLYKVRFGYFSSASETVECARYMMANDVFVFIGVTAE